LLSAYHLFLQLSRNLESQVPMLHSPIASLDLFRVLRYKTSIEDLASAVSSPPITNRTIHYSIPKDWPFSLRKRQLHLPCSFSKGILSFLELDGRNFLTNFKFTHVRFVNFVHRVFSYSIPSPLNLHRSFTIESGDLEAWLPKSPQ